MINLDSIVIYSITIDDNGSFNFRCNIGNNYYQVPIKDLDDPLQSEVLQNWEWNALQGVK